VILVAVETTSRITSVALFDDGTLKGTLAREERGDVLLVLVDELLRSHGLTARDVGRWAVDIGPGSFTGTRVGVSTIKGIAFATGADVVAVNAFDAISEGKPSITMLDAGKGEVYYRIGTGDPGHAPEEAVRTMIEGRTEPVIGPGVVPRAEGVGRVALHRTPDDVDAIEPLYVRAPDITTKPR
jgi:tRNA threonylcarbamoyl adenosine modification protein YeaZ